MDQDQNNFYEDEDEEVCHLEKREFEEGNFNFIITIDEGDLDGFYIESEMMSKDGTFIGRLNGNYIERRGWQTEFIPYCDSMSQELLEIGRSLCYNSGKLRSECFEDFLTGEEIKEASDDGFLTIQKLEITKKQRGNDFGFIFLKSFFNFFWKQWNICVVCPFYLNNTRENGEEGVEVKDKMVMRLFSRFSFQQLSREDLRTYFFLTLKKLKVLSKGDVEVKTFLPIVPAPSYCELNKIRAEIGSIISFEQCFDTSQNDELKKLYLKAIQCLPQSQRSSLVGGLIPPRMMEQLIVASDVFTDNYKMDVEGIHCAPRCPIDEDELDGTLLGQYIPEEIKARPMYKSYLKGMIEVLEGINFFLNRKELPTFTKVYQYCSWPFNHKFYFEKGGKLAHCFQAIVGPMKSQSWEHGDGTIFEIYELDLEKYQKIDILDNDIKFLQTYVLDYLETH